MHFTCYLIGITWKYTRVSHAITWEFTCISHVISSVSHVITHLFHMLSHRFHMGIYTCFTCDHMEIYMHFTYYLIGFTWEYTRFTCDHTCILRYLISFTWEYTRVSHAITWKYTRGVTIHRYGSIQCMTIRCIDATRKISISVKRHLYFDNVHIFT